MITPSHLYAHLKCPTRVHQDAFGDPALKDDANPFVQLLWERGTLFEKKVIESLALAPVDLSALSGDMKEAATRAAIRDRVPLIYAGRLSVDDLLGEPDLLRLEGDGYVPIDIKSGAGEEGGDDEEDGKPKKTYGAQIALYVDLLIRLGVSAGRHGYIWDIHGVETRYVLDDKLGPKSSTIWEVYLDARHAVEQTLAGSRPLPSASSTCKLCVWRSACHRKLKAARDLTLIPELGRAKRDVLADQFPTVEDLAVGNVERFIHGKKTDFPGIGPGTIRKFQKRAVLLSTPGAQPYLTQPIAWPESTVELFFDIETDPMRDLCYLHGFVIREGGVGGKEHCAQVFAERPDAAAEKEAFIAAMGVFRAYPQAVVVHFSPYERTEFRKLQRKYPDVASAEEIEALYAPTKAFDLMWRAVFPASEWPAMDRTIKSLAKFCGFRWRDTDPSGASSIQWFDEWASTGDQALKERLLQYNEDDCVAMRVVMDYMKGFEIHT